jgi:hypothetical protein
LQLIGFMRPAVGFRVVTVQGPLVVVVVMVMASVVVDQEW